MNKFWRVAIYEYTRNVFKKSFLMVILSVPLMLAVSIGMGMLMEKLQDNSLPVGYVDRAGIFTQAIPAPLDQFQEPIQFIAYPAEDQALAALEANQIQAYYVLPADFFLTRQANLVYNKKPGNNATRQFYDFLQINLVSAYPADIANRIAAGSEVTVRSMDGKRELPGGGPTFGLLMPLLVSMAFLFLILMSSGYLMGAIADEKENRTIEILFTSISPTQLLGGKIVGIVGIGLTLLTSWTQVVLLSIFILSQMGVTWFQNLEMDWGIILATVAIALPAYILTAGLMTAIGAMVTSTQEGQSLSSIFIILHILPIYVSFAFLTDPNGVLAVILSILPFTSLVTVAFRNLFTAVPAWQVAVSVMIQSLGAVGTIWLAGRAFRLGMLRYGQRLTWKRLIRA
jgi:ABC-2 type transport system permease protein